MMDAAATPLALLSFPLTGCQLIEASAGTGKTFTIAALYVRLVLGHGGGPPLLPPQITVVTFTEAATLELRARIRAYLVQAADCFKADGGGPAPAAEDFLADLRGQYPPSAWPGCARRLQLASTWMDEAAICTIHAWCGRMLREHALASQHLCPQQIVGEQTQLFAEVVRDYWRQHVYPLAGEDIRQLLECWPEPSALAAKAKPLLRHTRLLPPAPPPAVHLPEVRRARQARLQALKQPWPAWLAELEALFAEAKRDNRLNGQKLKADRLRDWLGKLGDWASSPQREALGLSAAALARLSPEGIADAWRAGPPAHPAFAALQSLPGQLASLPTPKPGLLAHAVGWLAPEFVAAQQRLGQISFDQLLAGLAQALAGGQGPALAAAIRQKFPVALIDEFQDTDPVQYQIFSLVYQPAARRRDCGLIFIGDPKQAIYGFRGADIHTYLRARAVAAGCVHTLATNHRSTAAMVAAVNHCFAAAERRPGGAFLFANDGANPLPFHPVQAKGRAERFMVEGQEPAALTLAVWPEAEVGKTRYREQMAQVCATQIVRWLNQGQGGVAGFVAADGGMRALMPADLAVLVNDRHEAALIRQALARRGVRSVYLSEQDSVYASRQAQEIWLWLRACVAPDNDRWLRAALATPSLGLPLAELAALEHDEAAWERRLAQFGHYQRLWRRRGVLAMLRALLFDFGCVERLLGQPPAADGASGERQLTDLLHLAELLQEADRQLGSGHALLRFLAEQLNAPTTEASAHRIRLESDARLLKVVTIHKSKGLEYPLVLLPFIAAGRSADAADPPFLWHDGHGQPRLDWEASAEIIGHLERDLVAEDTRKLYVALTRARHLCWLGLAAVKGLAGSAIGRLLAVGDLDGQGLLAGLRGFADGQQAIAVTPCVDIDHNRFSQADAGAIGTARPAPAARGQWRVGSYSSLCAQAQADDLDEAALDEDSPRFQHWREAADEASGQLADGQAATVAHRFPAGPEAGACVHELLRWAATTGLQTVVEQPRLLFDEAARHCQIRRWQGWARPLGLWLSQVLQQPLPLADGASTPLVLHRLGAYIAEMEFWFASDHVDLGRLDGLVRAHCWPGQPRPQLRPDVLHGMVKGFVDLVFEHDGKYYVADYKSNWLGPDTGHYQQRHLERAMLGQRYDLQAAIYLLALQRLLRSRLADYRYERHIGGALYLFLRAIDGDNAGVCFMRPPEALLAGLDKLFGGGAGEGA